MFRWADGAYSSCRHSPHAVIHQRLPHRNRIGGAKGLRPMAVSRFVFLARRTDEDGVDDRRDDVSWMLVSSNSRPLGRAVRWHHGMDACLAEVRTIRAHLDRLHGVISVVNAGRNWRWR